ncbi:MAG: hypothetical protein Q8Q12_11405 [bacterium]|nr:hypothetical protein [bacterium]
MTPRKEEDKEEGILERMLERLGFIGQNVERLVDRLEFYNSPRGRTDDELTLDDLYENGEY